MKNRNAIFVDRRSPSDLQVVQPVTGLDWTWLVYPDRPCFLRDGHGFVFLSSEGQQVCYPGRKVSIRKLFEDGTPRDPFHVTVDGRLAFYTEKSEARGGTFTLKRIDLETFRHETVYHVVGTLPGTRLPARGFTPDTVSADNRRLAGKMFLGDGKTANAPFGIVVLDLDDGRARVIAEHRDFINPHLQYCQAPDSHAAHDLMIQMNHGARTDENGKRIRGLGPPSEKGVDAHVIRDDGTHWRNLPWGRDGKESLVGHQVWRGKTRAGVAVTLENLDTSYGWADGTRQEVIGGWPVKAPRNSHQGRLTPGGKRVWLSKGFSQPRFCHLASDASGLRLALDTFPIFDGERSGMQVFVAQAAAANHAMRFTYLLNSRITFPAQKGHIHAHPILSPDGNTLFFNSTVSGTRQFYRVTGFADR